MITLRQIAQEVIRLESGGDTSNDSQLSEGYTIQLARQASNKLLQPKVLERLSQDDRSLPSLMVSTYTVSVVGDSPNKYIVLPEFCHNLSFNKGLVIAPVEDPTNHFIPRHNPAVSRGLPCADLDPGQFSYWTKGKNVYFDDNEVEFSKVMVDLYVASPDSIGPDDALPIYPEMQYDLIMMTRQMYQNRPIQDKILDNNADIGVRTK